MYLRGLPFPPPWDLPKAGTEPTSPVPSALVGGLSQSASEPPGKPQLCTHFYRCEREEMKFISVSLNI